VNDWDDGLTDALAGADRDRVIACADLVGRAGARSFEIGFLDDKPPHRWYAHAMYCGVRIQVENHDDPGSAAMELAEKLLTGAKCRCGRLVALRPDGAVAFRKTTLADGTEWNAKQAAKAGQCRWRLTGGRWEPSCPVPANRRRGPL
jgi:hypothetical protein